MTAKRTRKNTHVLFIGKRFYTNRDALQERYGRIYQLPLHWAAAGISTRLWLLDYHSRESVHCKDDSLLISSHPILSIGTLKSAATCLIADQSYTHVIGSGDCYLGFLGYIIARRAKATFVFDVYDKYDEFSGYRRLPGVDLFPFLLAHADQRLFASQALMEQFGEPRETDLIVQNGLDVTRFRPLAISQCRQQIGLPGDAVFVGYFGGMEPDRGVADLINAVQQLRREGLGIELLLGGKPCPGIALTAPGIRYIGNVPFHEMPHTLGACNLLAVPYRRSALMDAGASNKIAEGLACARPIVATRTPNFLANFAEAAKRLADRLAEPGNAADIARVIRAQLTSPVLAGLPPGWDWSSIARRTASELGLVPAQAKFGR